jgi:hypothetical protein
LAPSLDAIANATNNSRGSHLACLLPINLLDPRQSVVQILEDAVITPSVSPSREPKLSCHTAATFLLAGFGGAVLLLGVATVGLEDLGPKIFRLKVAAVHFWRQVSAPVDTPVEAATPTIKPAPAGPAPENSGAGCLPTTTGYRGSMDRRAASMAATSIFFIGIIPGRRVSPHRHPPQAPQ